MKKILCSVVFLVLVNLTVTVVSAQRTKQSKSNKSVSSFDLSQNNGVNFKQVKAISDGNGTFIKWETSSEIDNLGFNVYRMDGKNRIRVNNNLIAGRYLIGGVDKDRGDVYTFFDRRGTINSSYQIETVTLSGRNETSNLFYSRFENNLKTFAGQSSQAFQKAASESNPINIKNNPVLPTDLKRSADASNSLADINKQREVASKPGVKIGVKNEGIYRVTKAELLAGGFDVNTSPVLWQLFYNGVQQAINVEPNGDYIEFYGKGIDTLHSDINIYFLITGDVAGKRMGTTIRRRIGGSVVGKNFDYSLQRRDRSLYISSLLNDDFENFYGAVISSTAATISFDVNGIDFQSGKAKMFLTLQGLTDTAHVVEIKINGEVVDNATGANKQLYTTELGIPTSYFNEGSNTLELKSIGQGSDFSLFSSLQLDYKRTYTAAQDELAFYTRNLRLTTVKGFTTPDIRVLDITYPDAPTTITNASVEPVDKAGSAYQVTLPAHRRKSLYAFAESELKSAHSIVENFPSTISATSNEADLVIITHRDWLTESNSWATYRQNDGLNVSVVDVDDVYDEFDYGVKGSDAIREFINYTQTSWQTAPGYVLLMGDASYDPKNYTGDGFHSYVPVRLVDTLYEETGSDEALADYDDDGLSEVAIGRIPARNPQQITDALNKVISFEQGLGTAPARGSLCVSDSPIGYNFAQLCQSVQNQLPASIPTIDINRDDANARTDLLNTMNEGKYLVNYSGHGSAGFWATNSLFNVGDATALSNQNDLSVYTMLTCLNGYFLRPVADSLSERLLNSTGGGAVAVWSSSGSTTPDIQQVMATRFFNQLGNNTQMNRMGDFIQDAKANLVGGRDVRRSWGLLGDPTLKVK